MNFSLNFVVITALIIGLFSACNKEDDPTPNPPVPNPPVASTMTDSRDGKQYTIVSIGQQIWMSENLAYAPSMGNYWAYDNNMANVEIFGYLYDWETACAVCPPGWHLPTDQEWTQLTDYVSGSTLGAGGKLKATGTIQEGTGLWNSPNAGATDEFNFSALPGGRRRNDAIFDLKNTYGAWWTASESDIYGAWYRSMENSISSVFRYYHHDDMGFSVRCVKD